MTASIWVPGHRVGEVRGCAESVQSGEGVDLIVGQALARDRSRAGRRRAAIVKVEEGREGDLQVGEQLPEVVGVPAPQRDHRDEGRVEVDAPGPRDGGNDQFLGVTLAEHDELGEVQLGVRADRFAYVLASLRGAVRQSDRPDGCGTASVSSRKWRMLAGSIRLRTLAQWLTRTAWARVPSHT